MAGKTKLTDAQIAGAAKKAGFTGEGLAKAVAIALAESSGYADSHNAIPPDDSYGLWQINMLGAMGPSRRKQFGLSSNTELYNPDINAKAAFAISSGGKNFVPWSTYTSGKYLGYLPRARKAAGNPDTSGNYPNGTTGGVQQTGLGNVLSWPGKIIDFFEFITDPYTWLRAGMLLAGGLLLIFSLYSLSGAKSAMGSVVGTVTDVLPQTRGLKAAAKVA